MADYRTLSLDQLLAWAEDNTDIMRLRSDRDVLPGGYMAAFAPLLVAWQESRLSDSDGLVVLRNVNYGGNPVERTTVLHSVRVPLDGIETAEFILVPLDRHGITHHVELRFIFAPQRAPELLNLADSRTGTFAAIPDLVFSWEAWRPPQLKFDLQQALDESVYGLTLRAFAGPQLYLEDSLRQREWFARRLQLPGGKAGLQELFKVVLALGDGVARDTLRRVLQQDEQTWLAHAPAGKSESARETASWQRLEARIDAAAPGETAVQGLSAAEQGYQPLVRSCATLARYTVLLATWRMIDRGHTEGVKQDRLPEAELGQVEGWMQTVAHADLRRVFLSAPAALRFLTRNPQAVPARIADELDAAGLVVRRDGKPWEIRYGRKATRPYTAAGVNPAV